MGQNFMVIGKWEYSDGRGHSKEPKNKHCSRQINDSNEVSNLK